MAADFGRQCVSPQLWEAAVDGHYVVTGEQSGAASQAVALFARTGRVVSGAIAVLTVAMLLSLASYLWDWSDVLFEGDTPEMDEWLALVGAAWLPVVAVLAYRLVRVNRELAETAQDALDAFADTVHTAHGWVWRVDTDHRIVYSSAGIRELLGYEPDEVVGRDALDLLVLDEDRDQVRSDVRARQDGWQNWQTRVRHRDGSVRHVRSSATPVHGKGGRLMAYRGFTADITAEVLAAATEQAEQMRHHAIRSRIEQAVHDPDALQIAFQPIIDLRAQKIVGMEALSRFTAEPYRTPDVWFDEAWQAGLGPELELHAITLACRRIGELPDGAYLSINASPATILDDRFARTLQELHVDLHRLVVEVTEHAEVADYPGLADAVARLRLHGGRLAVDDAGAGYASMQHILRLRPDIIKIDRGIVADLDHDAARHALVTAMAGFAASLNLAVVAEGVETDDELAALRTAGISNVQGYLLARPSLDPAPQWVMSAGMVASSR